MLTPENVFSAFGGLAALYELTRFLRGRLRSRTMFSWHEVEAWVDALYSRLQEADVKPDKSSASVAAVLSSRE
jgi:hypothetical protein